MTLKLLELVTLSVKCEMSLHPPLFLLHCTLETKGLFLCSIFSSLKPIDGCLQLANLI